MIEVSHLLDVAALVAVFQRLIGRSHGRSGIQQHQYRRDQAQYAFVHGILPVFILCREISPHNSWTEPVYRAYLKAT